MSPTELGGFKEVILGVEGEGVYRELQYESGGHRVQRVPETEQKGRIHTSAATVAVLPEPEDVEIDIKPDDYRKDLFCASGPGGQHVNKTQSAVRLTHLRDRHRRAMPGRKEPAQEFCQAHCACSRRGSTSTYAMREQQKRASGAKDAESARGDRSERIRTYNFPQNRMTDHRIGMDWYKLDSIIAGNLQPVTEA